MSHLSASDKIASQMHIEKHFGHSFKNIALLERALTHRSAAKSIKNSHYERLEFLGDAVLGLCMAHLLSDNYPTAHEGELSKMRASLVNTATLADVARSFSLGQFIVLSPSEAKSGGKDKSSILADILESIIGAIYIEDGFNQAFKVVSKIFAESIKIVTPIDPKTELQELAHTLKLPSPEYTIDETTGPDHAPVFSSSVKIDGKVYGKGQGATKKISQQNAAIEAMAVMKKGGDL